MNSAPYILADLPVIDLELTLHFEQWVDTGPGRRFGEPPRAERPLGEGLSVPVAEPTATVLRGLFGHALKHLLHPDLPPHIDPPAQSEYWPLCHPRNEAFFVLIQCPSGSGAGCRLPLVLRFFGLNDTWMRLCVEAFCAFQARGFGPERVPYRVEEGELRILDTPWSPDWRPSGANVFDLELLSPASLKHHGSPLDQDGDLLQAILISAQRHTEQIVRAYARNPVIPSRTICDKTRKALCEASEITWAALEPVECLLRSGKRKIPLDLSGIRGSIRIEGPPELERYLRVAELIGIGSRLAYGNGRVRLHVGKTVSPG